MSCQSSQPNWSRGGNGRHGDDDRRQAAVEKWGVFARPPDYGTAPAESAIHEAALSVGFRALSRCPDCGYWNIEGAEYCRDCGACDEPPETLTTISSLPTRTKANLALALALLALFSYEFPLLALPAFVVASYCYYRLWRRRELAAREAAERKLARRVTLGEEERLFRCRMNEIVGGMNEFDALLRDDSVTGVEREATEGGSMALECQLLNVNTRLNEFAFFRWQNKVEAAAHVVASLGANFAGSAAALKRELFALYEEGDEIAGFWKRAGDTDVFRKAADEYLPRIESLRAACLRLEERTDRLRVLHAFSRIRPGVEDAAGDASVSNVLLDDNPFAAETAVILTGLSETHLDDQLLFEKLRVEALAGGEGGRVRS